MKTKRTFLIEGRCMENAARSTPLATRRFVARVLVVGIVLTVGCSKDDRRRSSSPIQIGETVSWPSSALDDLPYISLRESHLLGLGTSEGQIPYEFKSVLDVSEGDNETIVVADRRSRELLVFDRLGNLVRNIDGRSSSSSLLSEWHYRGVSKAESGMVAVLNRQFGLSVVNVRDGTCTESLIPQLPCVADSRWKFLEGECDVAAVFPDGSFLMYSVDRKLERLRPGRLSINTPGTVTYSIDNGSGGFRQLESLPGKSIVRYQEPGGFGPGAFWDSDALFSPAGIIGYNSESVIFARSDQYMLRRWRRDGTPERTISVEIAPRIASSQDLGLLTAWADTATAATEPARRYIDMVTSSRGPLTIPLFSNIEIDTQGRIWVQDYRFPPLLGPETEDRWTIFAPNGEPLARIEMSIAGRIAGIGENDVYVVIPSGPRDRILVLRVDWASAAPQSPFN